MLVSRFAANGLNWTVHDWFAGLCTIVAFEGGQLKDGILYRWGAVGCGFVLASLRTNLRSISLARLQSSIFNLQSSSTLLVLIRNVVLPKLIDYHHSALRPIARLRAEFDHLCYSIAFTDY